jgi:hypothetical protein
VLPPLPTSRLENDNAPLAVKKSEFESISSGKALVYSSICRELANARVSLSPPGGDLDCSSVNDLLRDCFGVVGRIARI